MKKGRWVPLVLPALSAALLTGAVVAEAQQVDDRRVADLVAAGWVRVAIGLAPIFAHKDTATGQLRGVAVDLAQALASRMGIEFAAVEYARPGAVLEGVRSDAWDVAFQGIDPSRASEVDFTPAYLKVDLTFLVPAGSSIRNIADADEPGVRIAVPRRDLTDLLLGRMLKRAELVRSNTVVGAFDLLQTGHADASALPLPNLIQYSGRLPGSRIVEGRFGVNSVAMAVPKGRTGRLAYVREFLEDAKASGLVQQAIARDALRGVEVAPPEALSESAR